MGLKVDYIKVARIVGQHEAYNALFGPDIPRAKDKACRWCGAYHLPDVNCGPTMETKLKSKDEIDQLVQNVSVMIKIFEKAKRSNEEDKKLAEFIQRAKEISTRLQAPSARTHDGKTKVFSKHVTDDCFQWTKSGRCHANEKVECRFKHDEAKKGTPQQKGSGKDAAGPADSGSGAYVCTQGLQCTLSMG